MKIELENKMKTTLFKAQAVSVCTHNGYVLLKPAILASISISKQVIWHVKPPPEFVKENPLLPPAGLWIYYDQEIDIVDGKATVKGIDSVSKQEIETIFEFTVIYSRPIQESDLTESAELDKQVSIEQLQSDSDNYRFLLEKATEKGLFHFDQIGGCIEIWDDSDTAGLDKDITQMRKAHESRI